VEGENITITLLEDVSKLEEVVVVGYGTQKKKDLTGSIAHLEMQGTENAPNTNLVQALQGIAPGLNAKMGSTAGSSGGISIRGRTSISASDSPLIVLDGIIYNGDISDLNVNDIASIDVLKDASAAAVYGSRSANGVIVVSSKRGKSNKPKFNFNAYGGIQDLHPSDRSKMMNGDQFVNRLVDYYYQQELYDWYDTDPTDNSERPSRPNVSDKNVLASYLRSQEEQNNFLEGNEVNWMDQVFRAAPVQSYSMSVSGSSEKTNYYMSTSLTDQDGILENDSFKRYTFFGKFSYQLADWFNFEFAPQYTRRDYSGVAALISDAMDSSPWGSIYNENGDYPLDIAGESLARHPLGNALFDDEDIRDNLNLIFKGKFNLPSVEGLSYQFDYAQNYYFSHTYRYQPTTSFTGASNGGIGSKNNSTERKWLINNILSYDKSFGKNRFNLTLLHSEEEIQGEGTEAYAYGFSSEKLGYHALEVAENQETSSSAYQEYTRSFMGRLSYTFNDRYLLTGTIRRDGFSGFGENKKWANFPSASIGWIISEENFLSEVESIDYLKLRLSYGINGNQGIGRYNSQSIMSTNSTVFDGSTAIGLYSSSLGNDDLGWERTKSINLGFDFQLFGDRLNGSVDAYTAETSDVLVQRGIPRVSGNSSVWTNIGGMKNKGLEIALNTKNVETENFSWNSGFTFVINRNEITKLYDGVTEDIGNGWFVGESIYAIYGYETDGIYQEEDLFNGTIIEGYYPGQYKIIDQNGDQEITAEDDRKVIGSTDPNYRFSINNEIRYKNVGLSFFLNSIQGGGGRYMANNSSALVAGGTDYAYRVNRTAVEPYWTPENRSNTVPGIYYNPKIAPGVYQDKSFVRLQDVSLFYNIDQPVIESLGLTNARIYVSGKNLYTWTNWSGWDPDVEDPIIRSIVMGLNINF